MNTPPKSRNVIGCMTGTSMDGLDAALVRVEGNGLNIIPRFLRGVSLSYGNWQNDMRLLAQGNPLKAAHILELASKSAQLHVEAISQLSNSDAIDLVVLHGQTVFHKPPVSWQLINPWQIAEEIKTPLVFDLRGADLASGGQGAPITPLADFILFHSQTHERAIVNLGGFCNVTLLPRTSQTDNYHDSLDKITGGDVCACNHLLDSIARKYLNKPFDFDGNAAARGQIDENLYSNLYPQLSSQSSYGRSLGTNDELTDWIFKLSTLLPPESALRTVCASIAQTIADYTKTSCEVILAGGSVHNRTLVAELRSRTAKPVILSDSLGVPSVFRESIAMAVLGTLAQDGLSITLPQITGCKPKIRAGCWIFPLESLPPTLT